MINLALAESLFSLVLLILAYFVSMTIGGIIQTWVASKMGDDTAYDAGYGSFNPLMHFDLFSFLAVLIFRIGWPQMIPFNPFAILGSHRLFRLFIIHISEAASSLLLALTALVTSVAVFGYGMTMSLTLKVFSYFGRSFSLFFSSTPHLNIASVFDGSASTSSIVVAFFLISIVYLNIFIATLSIILNGLKYFILLGFEKGYKYIDYSDYITLFGPLVIVFFYADSLGNYLLKTTLWAACKIALLLGAYHL